MGFMNTVVSRWLVKVTQILLGGGVASLIFILAISRGGNGLEGGTVFMLLLFGLLLIGILMLKTTHSEEAHSSTAGVLKPRSEKLEKQLEQDSEEPLPDPLDTGFEIPL